MKLKEEMLLETLLNKSGLADAFVGWKERMKVQQMQDGGMGSLLLFPEGKSNDDRLFGQRISELIFTDSDGVQVIVSLNIDSNGQLFELDFWKIDFSPLINLPEVF